MAEQLHTVAVYAPGDSFNRVLIPGLLMGAEDAPREALVYAARAIAALNGAKFNPSDRALSALGLRRIVTYECIPVNIAPTPLMSRTKSA